MATSLEVMIVERNYLLRQSGVDQPIDLPELLKRVQQVPGDDDGVKLRITLTPDSRAKAEADLKEALAVAGIPSKAITWRYGSPQ